VLLKNFFLLTNYSIQFLVVLFNKDLRNNMRNLYDEFAWENALVRISWENALAHISWENPEAHIP